MAKGQNFTPPVRYNTHTSIKLFESNLVQVLNRLFKQYTKENLNLTIDNFNTKLTKACSNTKLNLEQTNFFMNILENKDKVMSQCKEHVKHFKVQNMSDFYLSEKELLDLFKNESCSFVQSDKGVGFVKISDERLLEQFEKINIKQGFSKSNVVEADYLREMSQLKRHLVEIIPKEVENILSYKFIANLKSEELGEIGILRLLPKILKLKHPSFYSIDELTSRGIKSSMHDPINSIASILSELSKTLYENLKTAFKGLFGMEAPPKLGSDQAMKILSQETFHEDTWKSSLEVSGDFTDMYSNAQESDVISAYKLCFKYSNFCHETELFILELIQIVLRFNFFKQPTGIYTSDNGFAMGCKTSAISTDILLLASEFNSFWNMSKVQIQTVKRFFRFRDDLNLRLMGNPKILLQVLSIIATGYPKSIDLNIKVTFLSNTFLNLRFYVLPTKTNLSISILRKKHDKFDIVQSD